MTYYLTFTYGDKTKKLMKTTDKEKAVKKADDKKAKYIAKGKSGIITLYVISTERGMPMQKCLEFWET